MGTTSNHHAPYDLGYTRTTMAVNKGKQSREVEPTPKNGPSSDCRLQLACMKSELLVIADQHAAVNTFPGLVHTARHTMGAGNTRSQLLNPALNFSYWRDEDVCGIFDSERKR